MTDKFKLTDASQLPVQAGDILEVVAVHPDVVVLLLRHRTDTGAETLGVRVTEAIVTKEKLHG